MARRPVILITRPEGDAEVYALELEALGFKTLSEPMLEIEPATFAKPDLDRYQALIFTSARAVRLFCERVKERDLPVYVVGERTASEARKFGFDQVFDAGGTGDDLAALVAQNITDKFTPLLHVRGEHVARPLDEMLAGHGIKLEPLVVYTANKIERFSSGFSLKDVDAVTFFSKRTAGNFMRLIKASKNLAKLRHIKALCISEAVLKCVQPDVWEQTYVADTPDRRGMEALLGRAFAPDLLEEAPIKGVQAMTKNNNAPAIENAEAVIERFGGIRPMAKKVSVAVTTIQGWKKRNVIPAARRDQILEAAEAHDVDLSDIIQGAPDTSEAANENVGAAPPPSGVKAKKEEPAQTQKAQESRAAQAPASDLDARLAATEKKAVTKSTWINVVLIAIAIASVVILLWPTSKENGQNQGRLSSLETDVGQLRGDVDAVKAEQSFLSTLIPQDLDERIASLQEQARATQEKLGSALEKAGEVTSAVMDEDSGTLGERIAVLEDHAADFAASPQIAGILNKFKVMDETEGGKQQLNTAVSELNALLSGLGGEDGKIEQMLSGAQEQSPNLNQTFENVPKQDMKAAALLLGMTQFRKSLNRDNQPFDQDLQLLIKLTGKDNPELAASLQKLAPHAEQGVLTPGGLTNEFKSLAGEAVVASLSGEDVSISDKARARFNDILQVEKDGELITGTPVQAKVTKAESLLEAGDIQGAIAQMETLDGDPRAAIEPWLDDAKATVLAQQLKNLLNNGVGAIAGGDLGLDIGGSKLIRDEATGINILRPGIVRKPPKGFQ